MPFFTKMALASLHAITRPMQREIAGPRFQDMSHTIYYAYSSNVQCTRTRSSVRCQASTSSSGAGKPGRRDRVRRRAAQVTESLEALERDGDLASYNLCLPSSAAFCYETAMSSSSSSSSESEDDSVSRRSPPAAKVATQTATISVCQGKACQKRGSDRVLGALHQTTAGVAGIDVTTCKCLGQCKRGPAVKVEMPTGEEIIYVGVHGADSAVQLASIVLN